MTDIWHKKKETILVCFYIHDGFLYTHYHV